VAQNTFSRLQGCESRSDASRSRMPQLTKECRKFNFVNTIILVPRGAPHNGRILDCSDCSAQNRAPQMCGSHILKVNFSGSGNFPASPFYRSQNANSYRITICRDTSVAKQQKVTEKTSRSQGPTFYGTEIRE